MKIINVSTFLAVGGLAHVLTMQAYASSLPPGVVNFVSGSGRETMGPAIKSGIDIFSFIGSSKAANALLHEHPSLHRLKVFLSLEGKNMAIICEDANLDIATEQITLGSISYNGQRCTAIKIIFVHSSIAVTFIEKLKLRFASLKAGLPWGEDVSITPLPEPNKIKFLQGLIDDALANGSTVVNAEQRGGQIFGNIMYPAIIFPVTIEARLWHEEQFGPIVPIAVYSDISEVNNYIINTPYGLQASIFTTSAIQAASLIDILSTSVGRINLNVQCSRSPDIIPFTGRKSSALGTLSITEALKTFSIETVIATKANDMNNDILISAESMSHFLAPIKAKKN